MKEQNQNLIKSIVAFLEEAGLSWQEGVALLLGVCKTLFEHHYKCSSEEASKKLVEVIYREATMDRTQN